MPYNININGLRVSAEEKPTIKNIIEKFFDSRCECLVSLNSKPILKPRHQICRVKENDILQVITYCKNCQKIKQRRVFDPKRSMQNSKEI